MLSRKISTGTCSKLSSRRISSGDSSSSPSQTITDQDDVYNFKIISSFKMKSYWISVVHYPNCSNFEGKKILVTKKELTGMKKIDPHFFEEDSSDNIGLVARFVPNQEGMRMALILTTNLP